MLTVMKRNQNNETFADELRYLAGKMTAHQIAFAVAPSGECSPRTVENWLAGRNEPPAYARPAILGAVHSRRIFLKELAKSQIIPTEKKGKK